MASSTDRTVIVEARDLDTDARTVAAFEVEMPVGQDGQRAQLAELVARVHPAACLRSFGNGAASFLDSEQLVVAHYRQAGPPEGAPVVSRAERLEQQPLFVA